MYRRGKFTERVRDMADVSAAFRDKLARRATFDGDLELESVKLATDGTRKILYRLKNGGGVGSRCSSRARRTARGERPCASPRSSGAR